MTVEKTIIFSIYTYTIISIIFSLTVYFACDNMQFLQAFNIVQYAKAVKGISQFVFIFNFILCLIGIFINVCIGAKETKEKENREQDSRNEKTTNQ